MKKNTLVFLLVLLFASTVLAANQEEAIVSADELKMFVVVGNELLNASSETYKTLSAANNSRKALLSNDEEKEVVNKLTSMQHLIRESRQMLRAAKVASKSKGSSFSLQELKQFKINMQQLLDLQMKVMDMLENPSEKERDRIKEKRQDEGRRRLG